jgi:inosine/xanthosine triphosphatase
MKIAVGSGNPVKISAVEAIIARVWPMADVESIPVASGVNPMPMDDDECISGAMARALASRAAVDADLGVGLEGGVHWAGQRLFLTGWVAVVDRNGRNSFASASRLPLPEPIAAAVRAGRELGPLMDEVTGRQDTRLAEGAIGILTHGLMTRQASFEAAVAYALAPWLSPELYS